MTLLITIFLISIITSFFILSFSAWEVRNNLRQEKRSFKITLPNTEQLEKFFLVSLKEIIQGLLLLLVKYWVIFVTKIKKWFIINWPKIKARFYKNKIQKEEGYPKSPSFVKRAIFESKIKIKRIKDKIKEDNDMKR